MNNKELVSLVDNMYEEFRRQHPLFYRIFFYAFKYRGETAQRTFRRLRNSNRERSLYRKTFVYNPLGPNRSTRGLVELSEFQGKFADLKSSVVSFAHDNDLSVVRNTINARNGLRGKVEVLLGTTLSFEHAAFSTRRLEPLLSKFAEDGLTDERLNDAKAISEIESIIRLEISWLAEQLVKLNTKIIFLHDDQRPAAALLCAAARQVGVKTVTVRHGYIGWSNAHSSSLPLNSDHFIVWSDLEAQQIHDLYPEYQNRVHSFGFPGLDRPKEELRLRPPSEHTKIVAYMCGPIWFMKERFGEDLHGTLWGVRSAVEAAGYRFLLRLHWKDRERALDEKDARIIEAFETCGASLVDTFERSTIVASSYPSSTLIEATAYGRRSLNITSGEYHVPWADNITLAQLSRFLLDIKDVAVNSKNSFRRKEFQNFLEELIS